MEYFFESFWHFTMTLSPAFVLIIWYVIKHEREYKRLCDLYTHEQRLKKMYRKKLFLMLKEK